MGMSSSIKPRAMPFADDLEGWKSHVAGLERQLEMARAMVASLINERQEVEAVDGPEESNDAS